MVEELLDELRGASFFTKLDLSLPPASVLLGAGGHPAPRR
jgi:hypothetical protein